MTDHDECSPTYFPDDLPPTKTLLKLLSQLGDRLDRKSRLASPAWDARRWREEIVDGLGEALARNGVRYPHRAGRRARGEYLLDHVWSDERLSESDEWTCAYRGLAVGLEVEWNPSADEFLHDLVKLFDVSCGRRIMLTSLNPKSFVDFKRLDGELPKLIACIARNHRYFPAEAEVGVLAWCEEQPAAEVAWVFSKQRSQRLPSFD